MNEDTLLTLCKTLAFSAGTSKPTACGTGSFFGGAAPGNIARGLNILGGSAPGSIARGLNPAGAPVVGFFERDGDLDGEGAVDDCRGSTLTLLLLTVSVVVLEGFVLDFVTVTEDKKPPI